MARYGISQPGIKNSRIRPHSHPRKYFGRPAFLSAARNSAQQCCWTWSIREASIVRCANTVAKCRWPWPKLCSKPRPWFFRVLKVSFPVRQRARPARTGSGGSTGCACRRTRPARSSAATDTSARTRRACEPMPHSRWHPRPVRPTRRSRLNGPLTEHELCPAADPNTSSVSRSPLPWNVEPPAVSNPSKGLTARTAP